MRISRILAAFAALLLIICASAASAVTYQMYDLGLVAPGYSSSALGINNRGEVVGYVHTGSTGRGFMWDNVSGLRYITPAGEDNVARDINDNGLIVGGTLNGLQNITGFTTDKNGLQYTRTTHELWAVNNQGQAVGFTERDGLGNVVSWDSEQGEQALDLDGCAYNINNNGMIAGVADGRGFVWDNANGLTDIGALGNYGRVFGINDSGQVSGTIWQAGQKTQAFIWDRDNGMQMLGILPGRDESIAIRMNNRGQIAGYCNLNYGPQACVWNGISGMQALPMLPGYSMGQACDINDDGWIVGWATDFTTNKQHAVVWAPVPEPSAILVLAAGVGALIIRKRR